MEPTPADRDDAARRGPVGHGDPQLADDDRARPRRGRVPRARARSSTPASSGGEMFEETADVSEVPRRGDRHARRQGATRSGAAHHDLIAQVEVVGKGLLDARAGAARRDAARAREQQGLAALRADGHRRARRRAPTCSSPATSAPSRGLSASSHNDSKIELPGRDEPQEASRAEAAGRRSEAAGRLRSRRPARAASCVGASPHSCSSR